MGTTYRSLWRTELSKHLLMALNMEDFEKFFNNLIKIFYKLES